MRSRSSQWVPNFSDHHYHRNQEQRYQTHWLLIATFSDSETLILLSITSHMSTFWIVWRIHLRSISNMSTHYSFWSVWKEIALLRSLKMWPMVWFIYLNYGERKTVGHPSSIVDRDKSHMLNSKMFKVSFYQTKRLKTKDFGLYGPD